MPKEEKTEILQLEAFEDDKQIKSAASTTEHGIKVSEIEAWSTKPQQGNVLTVVPFLLLQGLIKHVYLSYHQLFIILIRCYIARQSTTISQQDPASFNPINSAFSCRIDILARPFYYTLVGKKRKKKLLTKVQTCCLLYLKRFQCH